VAGYIPDWLERQHGPASDLDLAVLLINSLDNLEDPPDRLTSVDWFRSVTAQVGRGELTAGLSAEDLGGLRELRDCLRGVFLAESADEAAALLNPALVRAAAVAQLVITPDGPALEVAPGEQGLAALASHLAQRGMGRLGTCAAGPCACAFVDYTRGRSRRFCSTACNDRAAAQAYRQRKRGA